MADDRAKSEHYLRRALRLARRGRYRTSPNPMVGSLVVQGEQVVGEGYHRQVGGPHAEVEALRQAGEGARGATLFVTLEPCFHFGRTPPCTQAILAAGIQRVVACHLDPDPRVAGQGLAQLRAAGVAVECGVLAATAVRLNWRFLAATIYHRPAVTLKWAMSLDGKIATASGQSQWISSPAGRRYGLAQREEHDAVLVGSGTVLADDPRLDRRLGLARKPNLRVILDRRLRLPAQAKLFDVPGRIVVYTEVDQVAAQRKLTRRGALVIQLPKVEPQTVLTDLYQREVRSVLVEGGGQIAAAFAMAGLFDRVVVDCAPLLIGGQSAPGPLAGQGVASLAEALRLSELRAERRGEDLILSGFRSGCLQDLCAKLGVY